MTPEEFAKNILSETSEDEIILIDSDNNPTLREILRDYLERNHD